jgi:hypothetical protein
MRHRLQLLMGASALLYLGPLLAGLIAMGWSAVPVFIALFALWLVVMRPAQWPRDAKLWNARTALAAAAQIAVNALVVVALFGIGRGIGGVAGFVPHIPDLVPVALSFLATPLSRLVWDPAQNGAMGLAPEGGQSGETALALTQDDMVTTLLALDDAADPILTADALAVALRGPQAKLRLTALTEALDTQPTPRRSLREALILWATDPSRGPEEGLFGAQADAFVVAGRDDLMLHLFAHRALPLITAKPALWYSFPEAVEVESVLSPEQPANLQTALGDLARYLHATTPPEDRAGKPL